jgi:hypothetical protein
MILRTVRNDLNIVEVLLFDDFSLCPAEGSIACIFYPDQLTFVTNNQANRRTTRSIGVTFTETAEKDTTHLQYANSSLTSINKCTTVKNVPLT